MKIQHCFTHIVNIQGLVFFLALLISSFMMTSCQPGLNSLLEPGLSRELADYRSKYISDVRYQLHFVLPDDVNQPVTGYLNLSFNQARALRGVILDFQPGEQFIQSVHVNGKEDDFQMVNGHILLSTRHIIPARNQVEIHFTASEQALNRSDDFLYSLFVPDKASTAFPCFDQPNLRAVFELSLDIPAGWEALSNGQLSASLPADKEGKYLRFAPSQPIPTYLFAFAAGEFKVFEQNIAGWSFRLFHREKNEEKLQSNADEIMALHAKSLGWLEAYTGIAYPFEKFDLALLPGFQYSGMEHPGAVWYRDSRLLLEDSEGLAARLSRAQLIAHETAHMWFGNLVTMSWFDDVWLKEVFAGFMADKITAPLFDQVNHDQQFWLNHYPRAAAVDRSRGTHPIRQPLDNLSRAGSLYGAIIYNKAPLVFRQLEELMGQDAFQNAVREYLLSFSMGDADWEDLRIILDRHSPHDLEAWSRQWIYGTGMPALPLSHSDTTVRETALLLQSHEDFLSGKLALIPHAISLTEAMTPETDARLLNWLSDRLDDLYWRYARDIHRDSLHTFILTHLQQGFDRTTQSTRQSWIDTWIRLSAKPDDLKDLSKSAALSEKQRFDLAARLLLMNAPGAQQKMQKLIEATANPDLIRRYEFVLQSLSPDESERLAFFTRLTSPEGRRPEPWVLEGLSYLHHPLREGSSEELILPGLNMIEDVWRSGDIFFPLGWLQAILSGYRHSAQARLFEQWLDTEKDLEPSLRLKSLQAADPLLRAAAMGDDGIISVKDSKP